MKAKLETQRLHEAELQKELERMLETQRLVHEVELQTQELEKMLETQRLVHEAERQQLLARLKAVELGGK
jgi:hypothetical protein